MRKILLAILLIVAVGFSKTAVPIQGYRAFQLAEHNVNQVQMTISNYGKFGSDEVGAACWWPAGSQENYIFGAGSWFGTIDPATGDTLVTIGYGPHGGEFEYTPGLATMSFSDPEAIIYIMPDPWPVPAATYPMAPQVSKSHQDSWCAYNDLDETYHMPGDTRPIGLEVYQTVYAWNLSTTKDIIFLRFELKNVSGDTLKDCFFGICADNDIGNEAAPANNDIISGILGKWYEINGESLYVDDFGYQWQEEEEGGWAHFPGAIGFDYLQSPFDLVPGADKDNDGIPDQYENDSAYYVNNLPPDMWDVDLDGTPDWRDPSEIPQLGMTAFKRFTLNLEPNVDNERYITLAGYNFKTGAYEPYDTVPPDPDDQRWLQCSGPFDLAPDSMVTVLIGVVFAYWNTTGYPFWGTPDSALVRVDNTAQFIYDMNWLLPGPPPPPQLTLYPGDAQVILSWTSVPEMTADAYYDVVHPPGPLHDDYYRKYDFEGYRVWRSLTGLSEDWGLLATYDVFNDITFTYGISEGDTIETTNSGVVHSYIDEGVRNGFTYYYAITSFDWNQIKETYDSLVVIDSVPYIPEPGETTWVYVYDTIEVTGPHAIIFESGASGVATQPRRDPWNFVPAGEPQFEVISGNERLLDIIDAEVLSPLDVDLNRPIYLEFGVPETLTITIADTVDIDSIVVYDIAGVKYTVYLKDADDNIIATTVSKNRIGKSLHLDEFTEVDGISASFYNGTDSFPNPTLVFDSVEVGGSYPADLVGTVGTQIPSNAAHYCSGFWAHRGNDYQVTWHAKDPGGPVNTVVVVDPATGDTIPYKAYQSNLATRHLGECWCFTKTTNFVTEWTVPVSDTLVALGSPGSRTKSLYINGGLVTLRNNQYVVDTIRPGEGDIWTVYANREFTAAPVCAEVKISATPGYFDETTQLTLNVKVAPNPYIVENEWQMQPTLLRRLKFINLPADCTIRIFNLNGELVKTIIHHSTADFEDLGLQNVTNNAGGDEWWDLLSEHRQLVSSGVYIFHIQSDVGEQVGKFVIIR